MFKACCTYSVVILHSDIATLFTTGACLWTAWQKDSKTSMAFNRDLTAKGGGRECVTTAVDKRFVCDTLMQFWQFFNVRNYAFTDY